MKEKAPAFQWYPKDILSSQRVALMDLKEEGAYRRALDFCWLHGSLPSDLKALAKVIGKGCNAKIAIVVKAMFIEKEGQLIHDRLESERDKQEKWREKSRGGGKKSAEIRNQKATIVQPPLQNGINQNATLHSSSSSPSSTAKEEIQKKNCATAPPADKKHEKKKVVTENQSSLYTECMAIYATWFDKRFQMKPKIDALQGKSLKDIIAWMQSQAVVKGQNGTDEELVKNGFHHIFNNWDSIEVFYQQKTKLSEINSNIQNIIIQIKNPKQKSNEHPKTNIPAWRKPVENAG